MIKFEAQRMKISGKPVIRLVVRGNGKPQELRDLLHANGFEPAVDLTSTLEVFCSNAAEIDKARAGLDSWFDHTGAFVGESK